MSFRPRTVVLDSVSGWFDLAVAAQLGDEPKPMTYTSLKYNALMGPWHRDMRVMREINRRHKILVGVVGHIEHRTDWITTGYSNGAPIRDSKIQGWQLAVPGQGEKTIRAAFSEVWHLAAPHPNEAGTNPERKLFTCDHLWEGYKFESKSRKGIGGPITNPTWDSVMARLPQGRDTPEMVLLLGVPGVGKTTFFQTAPKPILFIDALGGCEESAKIEGVKVLAPKTVDEIFQVLKVLRDKGELP